MLIFTIITSCSLRVQVAIPLSEKTDLTSEMTHCLSTWVRLSSVNNVM